MSDAVVQDLFALVMRELKVVPEGVDLDTSLFEGGLELDSFAVVDLVSRIETHFGIQLNDSDFRPYNFADIRTLGGVIATYLVDRPKV